jgi:glycosyltransferase involved in cell wall biosynthesis
MLLELTFWSCAAFVFYAYAGYPIALYLLGRWRSHPLKREDVTPSVSLIITVHNEEARIERKLDNTVAIDYPADRLEIIVASDASTDATHAIVERYRGRGVRLVVSPERRGKEAAQKCAIDQSRGDILVFSDAATRLDPDGIRTIVRNFADESVGCVSSVDRLIDADGTVSGEGAYVRYETFLRRLESRVGSVVGLSGSFFAARREVCHPWPKDVPSDFITLLNTVRHGRRGIADEYSIGYYPNLADEKREYRRKVRTIVRGIAGLLQNVDVLNPFRFGTVAWLLFSHKVCRWLVPFALIGLFITNALLALTSDFFGMLLAAQIAFYLFGIVGLRWAHRLPGLARLVPFLLLANMSILNAWCDVVRGRRFMTWEPSRR